MLLKPHNHNRFYYQGSLHIRGIYFGIHVAYKTQKEEYIAKQNDTYLKNKWKTLITINKIYI